MNATHTGLASQRGGLGGIKGACFQIASISPAIDDSEFHPNGRTLGPSGAFTDGRGWFRTSDLSRVKR